VTGWAIGSTNKILDLTPNANAFSVSILAVGSDT
jgi:hypothetical protein